MPTTPFEDDDVVEKVGPFAWIVLVIVCAVVALACVGLALLLRSKKDVGKTENGTPMAVVESAQFGIPQGSEYAWTGLVTADSNYMPAPGIYGIDIMPHVQQASQYEEIGNI